jgi:transketolase
MKKKNKNLVAISKFIRIQTLKIINQSSASHIASCLSVIDILVSIYSHLKLKKRLSIDKVILSKGHAAAALYSTLNYFGFLSKKKLNTFYTNGSKLLGHASHYVNGIPFSTGSLGHGLGLGCGLAYANRLIKKNIFTYVVLSDGECDEGSIWEAALFAAHHKLKNLVVFIDFNKYQSIKTVTETLNLEPLALKWKSFNWNVHKINGHNFSILKKKINSLSKSKKPTVIICDTIKGKGVSFMENNILWHYRCPKGDEYLNALKELKKK